MPLLSLYTSVRDLPDGRAEVSILVDEQHRVVEKWGGRDDKPLEFLGNDNGKLLTLASAYVPQTRFSKEGLPTVYLRGFDKGSWENLAKHTFPDRTEADAFLHLLGVAVAQFNEQGGFGAPATQDT